MKRLLSFAVAAVIALSASALSASAVGTDYNSLYYTEACGLMSAIGIVQVTEGASLTSAAVSRAELLKYVLNLVHNGSIVLSDSSACRYSDVTGETAAYIEYADSIGIFYICCRMKHCSDPMKVPMRILR